MDKVKEEFEEWAKKERLDLAVFINGEYSMGTTHTAWLAWQAALADSGKGREPLKEFGIVAEQGSWGAAPGEFHWYASETERDEAIKGFHPMSCARPIERFHPALAQESRPSKDRDTWSAEMALQHELATAESTIESYGSPYKALMGLIDWHIAIHEEGQRAALQSQPADRVPEKAGLLYSLKDVPDVVQEEIQRFYVAGEYFGFSWDNEDNEAMPETAKWLESFNCYFAAFEIPDAMRTAAPAQESKVPVDSWKLHCLEYIGEGDSEAIDSDDFEIFGEDEQGRGCVHHVSISEVCRWAAKQLRTYPTSPEPQWISCEDRLPTKEDLGEALFFWVVADGVIDKESLYWIEHEKWRTKRRITHWMPTGLQCPAPPGDK